MGKIKVGGGAGAFAARAQIQSPKQPVAA